MVINEVLESINLCINTRAKGCSKCRYNEANSCAEAMMIDAVKVIEALRSTMDAQQQRIAELEEVVSQRARADAAEVFICKLCAECEWEEDDGITIMQKKCGCLFPIECGKFKLAAAEDLRLALTQLRQGCCDTCKHEALDADEYPCNLCSYAGGGSSQWVWAKPEVDNGKQ